MTDVNLKDRYQKDIAPALQKELGLTNVMSVPRLVKVVVNVGIPKSDSTKKDIEVVKSEIAAITGQAPAVKTSKQSIAGFKIREGDPVGVSVVLRGAKMFDFLDKLCRIVLPQVKDFRGVKNTGFDGNGNYTLGLTEQIIFPEIDYAKVERVHGMEITIVTSTKNDQSARKLLVHLGMPFMHDEEEN